MLAIPSVYMVVYAECYSYASSASTHICIVPSRYSLTYSSGSSIARAFNEHCEQGVVFSPSLPYYSQCVTYIRQMCRYQCCCDTYCILRKWYSCCVSLKSKNIEAFHQFTMSVLFCVILFYKIFFPLLFPLSEFVKTCGKI